MHKDEFERRAAEMRARHATARTGAISAATVASTTTRNTSRTAIADVSSRGTNALTVPELPTVPPYSLLQGLWKPAHTKALLAALGDVHPLVVRAVRALGSQQVSFDGLICLRGDGLLDVAASTIAFPQALRLYDLLIRTVQNQGGKISVSTVTAISLDDETIEVRMREASERRTKQVGKYGFAKNEYFPTKQLWLMAAGDQGSRLKTLVREQADIDDFLRKLRRRAARLPKIRDWQEKKERAREEERQRWQTKWRNEEEQQRQWREQQQRFDQVFADLEKWTKAERIRAYAAAFEAHHIATAGNVVMGGDVDGWLRWLHWYAEHLDPLTRPEALTGGKV